MRRRNASWSCRRVSVPWDCWDCRRRPGRLCRRLRRAFWTGRERDWVARDAHDARAATNGVLRDQRTRRVGHVECLRGPCKRRRRHSKNFARSASKNDLRRLDAVMAGDGFAQPHQFLVASNRRAERIPHRGDRPRRRPTAVAGEVQPNGSREAVALPSGGGVARRQTSGVRHRRQRRHDGAHAELTEGAPAGKLHPTHCPIVNVTFCEWTRDPLVPVTVKVVDPADTFLFVLIVRVAVPDPVIDDVLNLELANRGRPDTVNVTGRC